MKILFIGDIVGRPGYNLVRRGVPMLVERHQIDLVVANVENAAAGFGITRETAEAILACGVDVMTSGNHVWDRKDAFDYIEAEPRLLRPANYPSGAPGKGTYVALTASGDRVAVINVLGRVFMGDVDDPFTIVRREIDAVAASSRVILVDFHAEATSEKIAMGWYLDGKVAAVIGTHTHVQTADEQILPGGTAYVTDVGMTGPHDSIIGMDKTAALARFLSGAPVRFETATGNPRLNAIVLIVDGASGRATGVQRLSLARQDIEADMTSSVPMP